MAADKSIEETAQGYILQIKFLEETGNFAVFLLDRFGHYYYVIEYITEGIGVSQEFNIEKLMHPDDLEVVGRIDRRVWGFLDTLPKEEKLAYRYIYELRVLGRGKYIRMIYQTRPLVSEDDNFLAVDTIDLASEQPTNTPVRFQTENCLTDEIVPLAIESATDALPTPHEKEILVLTKEGMLSKEISKKLNISTHTMDRHRQDILEKPQVNNIIEAIRSQCNKQVVVQHTINKDPRVEYIPYGDFLSVIQKIGKIGEVLHAKSLYLRPRKPVIQYEKHYLQRLHLAHQ